MKSPLIREKRNPILTPAMMPFDCYTVINAGVTKFEGDVLLLLRVETRERKTRFHVARSRNGIDFTVNPEPIDYPLTELDRMGTRPHRFDMRITEMDGVYYVFHANWLDPWGSLINLAKTTDFVHFESISHSVPPNRNAVLFPEKINGRYARLERPLNIDGRGGIWYSESPDLEEPWRVVAAPKSFILAPEEIYECVGQTPNVVFTGGGCEMEDGSYFLYYGGADTRMCLARTTISELTAFCLNEK